MKKILLVLFLLATISSYSQTLTSKDFKLCLDNSYCSDSIIRLSKEQLLKVEKVTTNFSWATIRSLSITTGMGNYTSEITTLGTPVGNTIDAQTKNNIAKWIMPGNFVTIEAYVYNKKGELMPWSFLTILIK
ncbi:hypothetical protein [Ferruginibacter albus]|uniref:hypothetical protein n=1 Tax=Ferruginibacter albus TaxID=2875540 RepID=UPI001CC5AF2C|nr:hypothetical protein [Ferruginibacter albus]UAY51877.1 hypothetical protein K9M53_14950 [Ferruginibacter albus]